MAVTNTQKSSKDRKQREQGQNNKKKGLFEQVLTVAINEEMAPSQFKTMVYGRDGRTSAMQYQTREYHY